MSRFLKSYWPWVTLIAVSAGTLWCWWIPLNRSTDPVTVMTLMSLSAGLLAAIFAAQISISQSGSADIWLSCGEDRKFKRRTTIKLQPDPQNKIRLDLSISNRGKQICEVTYLRLTFPKTMRPTFRAITKQNPRGLMRVYEPDFQTKEDYPWIVEAHIKAELWPGHHYGLGTENQIFIELESLDKFLVKWEAQTPFGHRSGEYHIECSEQSSTVTTNPA